MKRPEFLPHQVEALELTKDKPKVAYYLDMGLGKTFVGTEQLLRYGNEYNLCICQASKVSDWCEHFETYTDYKVIDYTKKKAKIEPGIIVVNYELAWRRPELSGLQNFTLLLDESSKVQHEKTKQTEFIMKLRPKNVILASGTPCNGKYENLYTQIKLLGVKMTKQYYMDRYIIYNLKERMDWSRGFPIGTGKKYYDIQGYKNVDELKRNLRKCGAVFMLADDNLDLPQQTEQTVKVRATSEYRKFLKDKVVTIDGIDYVGHNALTEVTRKRQLCSYLNKDKLNALSDLLESTEDRVIVFYNFQEEFSKITQICDKLGKKVSYVNGEGKDLTAYTIDPSSVTLVQFQAGAHGLNLQKANKLIMFSPTQSAELHSQAKGRIHRLGQTRPTFYWYLTVEDSIEEDIYFNVQRGIDYTLNLYREDK